MLIYVDIYVFSRQFYAKLYLKKMQKQFFPNPTVFVKYNARFIRHLDKEVLDVNVLRN